MFNASDHEVRELISPSKPKDVIAGGNGIKVELEPVYHMFRYLSEIQHESKGGYFKGSINVGQGFQTGNGRLLELSLVTSGGHLTPNLLLLTLPGRQKQTKQPKLIQAFKYNSSLKKHCHWRIALEWKQTSLCVLPEYPETKTRVNITNFLSPDGTSILLGQGHLQLSVVKPKQRQPHVGIGIKESLSVRTKQEGVSQLAVDHNFKPTELSKVRLCVKDLENCDEFLSSTVIYDRKKFSLKIQDVSQTVWCKNGGHKAYIVLNSPMSDEVRLFLLSDYQIPQQIKTIKVSPRLYKITTPPFGEANSGKVSLVLGWYHSSELMETGQDFRVTFMDHRPDICACKMSE